MAFADYITRQCLRGQKQLNGDNILLDRCTSNKGAVAQGAPSEMLLGLFGAVLDGMSSVRLLSLSMP